MSQFEWIHEVIALELKSQYIINTFVDTGTYHGFCALWASEHFETVHTIEADPRIYEMAEHKLKKHPNIRQYWGSSRDVLPLVLSKLAFPGLIWLDAHWAGGDKGWHPELEIEIINKTNMKHIILVNDLSNMPDITEVLEFGGKRKVTMKDYIYIAEPRFGKW